MAHVVRYIDREFVSGNYDVQFGDADLTEVVTSIVSDATEDWAKDDYMMELTSMIHVLQLHLNVAKESK